MNRDQLLALRSAIGPAGVAGPDGAVLPVPPGGLLVRRHGARHRAGGPWLMTTTVVDPTPCRRVRVWFGEVVIADYTAEPALAQRYAEAMDRRLNLPVTNDPVPAEGESGRRE